MPLHVHISTLSDSLTFCFQVGLKEVEDILRDVDLNGDGLVDFEGNTNFYKLLIKDVLLYYSV